MPDIVQPEYERETGASKEELKQRMKRLSEHGSKGFSTSGSASIRDLGFAMSSARSEGATISVKDIARRADSVVTRSRSASSVVKPSASSYVREAASTEAEEAPRPPMLGRGRMGRSMSVGANTYKPPALEEDDMPVLNLSSIKLFLQQEERQQKPQSSVAKLVAEKQKTSPMVSSPVKLSHAVAAAQPNSPSIVTKANAKPSDLGSKVAVQLEKTVEHKTFKMESDKRRELVGEEVKINFVGKNKERVVGEVRANGNSVSVPGGSGTTGIKKVQVSPNASIAVPKPAKDLLTGGGGGGNSKRKYTLDQLRQRPLPTEVDQFAREDWLLDSEFIKAFGLPPTAFAKLPTWKKIELRKLAKIF
ncbi:hypothetical protein BASA81_013759 [Batrachochytrium salamandrivorans]|nr:hypothetical protein BASA81_013759 [Batrachochytrium salamandrivorans]